MKKCWRQVILICPNSVTGGPEALHQLGHMVNKLGGDARFAYFGGRCKLQIDEDRLLCELDPNCEPLSAYAAYNPTVITEIKLDTDILLVFPEVLAELAAGVRGVATAVWWLSVDNALRQNVNLTYPSSRKLYFANTELIHFFQSYYAHDFLRQNGAQTVYPLFDYVSSEFRFADPGEPSPREKIAFFPSKGGELAKSFFERAPDLQPMPIANMTRAQVSQALATSAIYIDFGHHPGKDRVPREASVAGAVVLLHQVGAANFYLDHPLDQRYLFTQKSIETGALAGLVRTILAEREKHLAAQGAYRQRIANELHEFELQVSNAFFAPT